MTVGGQTFRQVLKVERVSGGDTLDNPFGDVPNRDREERRQH